MRHHRWTRQTISRRNTRLSSVHCLQSSYDSDMEMDPTVEVRISFLFLEVRCLKKSINQDILPQAKLA